VADTPAPARSWIEQLPRQPGPTPDTEYIQASDGLWIPIPKAGTPWQPPPPAPAPPPQPGMFDGALAKLKAFPQEFAAQIDPASILHENPVASAGRLIDRAAQGDPTSLAAQTASGLQQQHPIATALASAMGNRRLLIPETEQQIAQRTAPPDQTIAQGWAAFQAHPVQSTVDWARDTGEGLKNFAELAYEHPGTAAGSVVEQTAENPQFMLGGDAAIAARAGITAERVARAAQLGDSATKAAAATAALAAHSTSFGALMAGTEALHEAGDGAVDPSKVAQSFGTGAALAPLTDVLGRALNKPTIRITLAELRKGLDRMPEGAPETAAAGPLLGGPEGNVGTAPAPDVPGGGPGPAPTGTLSELFNQARAAGIAVDDLQPIMSDRLRRNISDEQARWSVQDLINAASRPTPKQEAEPVAQESAATEQEKAAAPSTEVASAPSQTGFKEAFASLQNGGVSEDLRNQLWDAHVAGKETVAGVRDPILAAARAAAVPTDDRAAFDAFTDRYLKGRQASGVPTPDENGIVRTEVAGQQIAVNVEPTELQKASGAYLKGHITVQGLPITIENPAGTMRSGTDANGKPWTSTLTHAYGYVKRTLSSDGDQVDAFVGPNAESNRVYVIDQHKPGGGEFDEPKAMVGFDTRQAALVAYKSNYPRGWDGARAVTPMSVDQFKGWLKNGDSTQPAKGAKLAPRDSKPPVAQNPAAAASSVATISPAQPALPASSPAPQQRAPKTLESKPPDEHQGGDPFTEVSAPAPVPKRNVTSSDAREDSILQFMAKHPRGIDSAEAAKQGIDPADMKSPQAFVGIKRAFRKGGFSFDQVAEALHEAGYPVANAQGSADPNVLLDGLDRELRGKPVHSVRNLRAMAEAEVLAHENRVRAELHEHVPELAQDLKPAQDMTELAHVARHYDEDRTDAALESQAGDDDARQRLESIIEHGRAREALKVFPERESGGKALPDRLGRASREEEGRSLDRESAAGANPKAVTRPAERRDLLGDDTRSAQQLADEIRRRDTARNTGQESVETGRPSDLFSAARNQADLTQLPKPKTLREAIAARKAREAAPAPAADSEDTVELPTLADKGEQPIDDAGEKIGGARKDKWAERGLRLSDLQEMTDGEAAKLVTKANVWKPDYHSLIGAGMDDQAASLLKVLYDKLAATPRQNTPQGRADYVRAMSALRDVATETKTVADLKSLDDKFTQAIGWQPQRGMGAWDENSEGRRTYWSIQRGRHSTLRPGYSDLRAADKLVEAGFPNIEPWQRRFEIRARSAGGASVAGIQSLIEQSREAGTPLAEQQLHDGYFSVHPRGERSNAVGYAPTREAATEVARKAYEAAGAARSEGQLPARPHLDEIKREGLPVRRERPALSDDFLREFGFRGIEFGNWAANDERQKLVNLAYDGLHDLASLMKIPPQALSLNGTLGLALAARGSGRAAAHYEPDKLVINMTKLSGAGSLAHEWGHALDHYFGEIDRDDSYKTTARGASGWYTNAAAARGNAHLRPEMREAWNGVMDALYQRDRTKAELVRERELTLEKRQARLATQDKRLAATSSDPSLQRDLQKWTDEERRSIGVAQQALAKARDEPEAPGSYGRVKSSYYQSALKLSGKSAEKGYWARPTEMFARGFEAYIFDLLKARGASSEYLVHGVEPERFASGGYKGNPYPVEDRPAINAAMQKLVDTLQTRPGKDGAPTLFARGGREVPAFKPEIASYLKRVETALAGHANVQVHDNPRAFGDVIDQDVPDDIAGAYTGDDGTLHFIASNLPDVATAQAIFRHEGFGHLAMERSPDFEKALSMVGRLREMGGKRINEIWNDVKRRYPDADDMTLRKEVIADMAERGVKNAIVDRAITGVKAVLRKVGIETEPHEAELRQMIVQAARGLPDEATKLSGQDRIAAYQVESHLRAGRDTPAADTLGKILTESDAIDALARAKRDADPRAIAVLKDLSADVLADTQPGQLEPSIEDAYHPVEASLPTNVLFARHAPMDAATKAARDKVMEPDGRDDLSVRDRLRLSQQALRNVDGMAMKQYWVDDLASMAAYEREINGGKFLPGEKSPLKAARSTRNLASQMAAVLEKGIPEYKDGAYHVVSGRQGLKQVLAPLNSHADGSLVTHWELYAAARRASRLINETNRDGTLREKNFARAEIDAGLALAKKYPELATVFEDLQRMWKQLLDLGEKAGTINPEARAIYEKHDYVPFYRAEDELGGARGTTKAHGGLANQREMSGRLTGKAAPLRNILENVVMNIANQLDAAQKNIATQKSVDQFQGVFATKIQKQTEAVDISNEQVDRAMKALGLRLDPNMTAEQRAMWTRFFHQVAPTDPDVIRVMRGGKAEYHRITDPLVLEALTSIQGAPAWLKRLDKNTFGILSGPKRVYTALSTAMPMYTARRFMRVLLDTWMQSNEKLGLIRNAHKDFYDAMIGHKDLYDMMMAGAGGAQGYDADPDRVRSMLISAYKDGNKASFVANAASPKTWWKLWRQIQNASKNEHMLRVYRAARAKGASVAEAAFRARDIEDLSMHGGGGVMRFINMTVPFLNPRIQGTYRMARGFKDNWRAYSIRGAAVMAGTLGLQAINWDNPRYQELPQWEKDLAWHAFIGDHHFIMPKPFELGLLFATLPERVVAGAIHAMGKKGGDTPGESIDAFKRALLDTFALNPTPQVLRPFLEQATNTDAFGNKILTDTESKLAPQAQYNAYTSPTIREIAGRLPGRYNYVLNSPARLQELVTSVTSSVGMTLIQGVDALTRKGMGYPDAPSSSISASALKSFYTSGEPKQTKYTDELYDMMDQANKVYDTVNKYAADHRLADARAYLNDNKKVFELRPMLNELGKQMKELQKRQAAIVESNNLSADQKKAAIDRITVQKNELARRVAPFEDFF
jgi:hypothetical protein